MDTSFAYGQYFDQDPAEAIATELRERRYASGRYTAALYQGADRAALADAVADLSAARSRFPPIRMNTNCCRPLSAPSMPKLPSA